MGGIARRVVSTTAPLARISVEGRWENLFCGCGQTALEQILPAFLCTRRWFGGKARHVETAAMADAVPLPAEAASAYILLLDVSYADGDAERYLLTLAHAAGARGARVRERWPAAVVAQLSVGGVEGVLYDATWDETFGRTLLQAFTERHTFQGAAGAIVATPSRAFGSLAGPAHSSLTPGLLRAEQSNTSIRYGDRLILKLFRRLEGGVNPDLEITSFLTEASFEHVPGVAGSLEYRSAGREAITLGILQAFVPNQGDAWRFTLDSVDGYFDRVVSRAPRGTRAQVPRDDLLTLAEGDPPRVARDLIGTYLESAKLLGTRTAELHRALAASEDPDFAPEAFTLVYQRTLYQSMRNLMRQVFDVLGRRLQELPADQRDTAGRLLGLAPAILTRCRAIADRRITAMRTRHHGDYHLGQVLWTGRDFVLFDFEGEPTRLLSTRRTKGSALRDVAGMIRSFDYAAHASLNGLATTGPSSRERSAALEPWADYWHVWVSSAFLRSYLQTAAGAPFVPQRRDELDLLLTTHLLEKSVYELGYELNNRPDWVSLPLHGILRLMERAHASDA